jgi:O-antigen/teichoic acid export membrane protein
MGNEADESVTTLATQGGIGLVGNIAGKVLGFTFVAVATRLVTPGEYGVFVLGVSIVMFIQGFASLNIHRSIDYFVPKFLDDEDYGRAKRVLQNAIVIGFISSMVGMLALILLRGRVASLFDEPRLNFVLLLMALLIPLQTVKRAIITSFYSIKKIQYRVLTQNLINPVIKTVAAAGLVLSGAGVAGLVGGQILGVTFAILFGLSFFLYESDWVRKAKPTPVSNKSLISYSLPLMLAGVIYSMVGQIDFFVIGYFRNSAEVGQYRVAYMLGTNLLIVLQGFTPIFKPLISEAGSNTKTVRRRYQLATRWITMLTLPMALTLALAPEIYLSLLFTEEYVGASTTLIILVLGYIINAGSGPEGMVLEGSGFTRITLFNSIVLIGTNSILDFILVPMLGMLGAAIATATALASVSLLGIGEIYHLRGAHPFSWDLLRTYMVAVIPNLLGAGIIMFLDSKLLIFTILPFYMIITYLLCLNIVGGFTEEDIEIVSKLDERIGYEVTSILKRYNN